MYTLPECSVLTQTGAWTRFVKTVLGAVCQREGGPEPSWGRGREKHALPLLPPLLLSADLSGQDFWFCPEEKSLGCRRQCRGQAGGSKRAERQADALPAALREGDTGAGVGAAEAWACCGFQTGE